MGEDDLYLINKVVLRLFNLSMGGWRVNSLRGKVKSSYHMKGDGL